VYAERWRDKEARVAATSPFSHLPGWRLMPVIVKANDDLRQEQFVSQLMHQFAAIFRRARVPVWMRPYDILATAPRGGLLQAVQDTVSLDALKRGDPAFVSLSDWFERHFAYGSRGAERAKAARLNFARSMAAYSVVTYLLAIKDRHNGNIQIHRKGHIIHIDFGFLLTSSPGGNMNFEAAPFKLTAELVEVMGGPRSSLFTTFRKLAIRAFLAARKYRERIILLVEMMMSGNSDLKCFVGGPAAVIGGLRGRFRAELSDRAAAMHMHSLIDASIDNWRSRWYDRVQRITQGIR
jgi:phosphatidylinositol 4-kinase